MLRDDQETVSSIMYNSHSMFCVLNPSWIGTDYIALGEPLDSVEHSRLLKCAEMSNDLKVTCLGFVHGWRLLLDRCI